MQALAIANFFKKGKSGLNHHDQYFPVLLKLGIFQLIDAVPFYYVPDIRKTPETSLISSR